LLVPSKCFFNTMEGVLVRSSTTPACDGGEQEIVAVERPPPESMAKIMHNRCYGGFGLSKQAQAMYKAKKGLEEHETLGHPWDEIARHDEDMIAIVEALGPEASGQCSEIAIKEIPAKFLHYYYIEEYDGMESVAVDTKQYKLDQIHSMITSTDAFQQATYHQRAVLEDILNVINNPVEFNGYSE